MHPAKERASLKNYSKEAIEIKQKDKDGKEFIQVIQPGQDYIYEGPDRAALFELWEMHGKPTREKISTDPEKYLTMGEGYRQNSEFMQAFSIARQAFGFKDVDAYLKYLGYDEEKVKEDFAKNASTVTNHDLPRRVDEIKKLGGGDNNANPREVMYGGFGEPAVR